MEHKGTIVTLIYIANLDRIEAIKSMLEADSVMSLESFFGEHRKIGDMDNRCCKMAADSQTIRKIKTHLTGNVILYVLCKDEEIHDLITPHDFKADPFSRNYNKCIDSINTSYGIPTIAMFVFDQIIVFSNCIWKMIRESRNAAVVKPIAEALPVHGFLEELSRVLPDEDVANLIMNLDKCPPECEFTVRELLDRNIDNIRTNYFGLMYLSTF
jgi:hypothetical protein